jgi:hypothetical protein
MKIWLFICWMLAIFCIPYVLLFYDPNDIFNDAEVMAMRVFVICLPLIITLVWKSIFKKD